MDNSMFFVHDVPYCLWEVDLRQRNMQFLDGINTDYFDYLIDVHIQASDKKNSSIALRTSLHHSIETLFSLIGGFFQAPDCIYAWIAKCSNNNLRDLIKKINESPKKWFNKLKLNSVSWEAIAKAVFQCYVPNTEKNKQTVTQFCHLWKRLANDFLDQDHIDEYNSIKHGFRIRSGGFALAVGLEHKEGVAPPPEEMKLLTNSEFGTSFFKIEQIGNGKDNRSVRSRAITLNWTIEKTILMTQLVSMSIKNVTSALKILNGIKPSECKFLRPVNDSDFEKPWHFSPSISSCTFDFMIPEDNIVSVTKKMIYEEFNKMKDVS